MLRSKLPTHLKNLGGEAAFGMEGDFGLLELAGHAGH